MKSVQKRKFSRWAPDTSDAELSAAAHDVDYRVKVIKTPHSDRPVPITVCYGKRESGQQQQKKVSIAAGNVIYA